MLELNLEVSGALSMSLVSSGIKLQVWAVQ